MSVLTRAYDEEVSDFYYNTAQCLCLQNSQILGLNPNVIEWDLHTVTHEQMKQDVQCEFKVALSKGGRVAGMAGWFDVDFRGSESDPAPRPVTLSTSPAAVPTHWGQQAFYLRRAFDGARGEEAAVSMRIKRRKSNQRMIDVLLKVKGTFTPRGRQAQPYSLPYTLYHIE